jgi:hypothetical protein
VSVEELFRKIDGRHYCVEHEAQAFVAKVFGLPECLFSWNRDPAMVWAPWGGQESGGCFDRRPGIAILELLRAEIAQR